MKKAILLILIVVISSLVLTLSVFNIDNVYYFFLSESLEKEYQLPFKLKFDYWGYDVSNNNYGLVICDENNGLLLYRGKKNSSKGYIETIDKYYLSQHILIFRITTNKPAVEYLSVDSNHRVEIINQSTFDTLEKTSGKQVFENEQLIRWLKFKSRRDPNIFFSILVLFVLLTFNYKLITMLLNKSN